MTSRPHILQSKLTFPRLNATLVRKRLTDRLTKIIDQKSALIVAGAGFGKTVAAAQAVAALKCKSIWYALDESDADFGVFFTYLVKGFKDCFTDFGAQLGLKLPLSIVSAKSRRNLLTEFLAEVEAHLNQELIIVLDDFHLIQQNSDLTATIEFLLAKMPANLHLILISRCEVNIKLSRYRAQLNLIEINEDDLAFGPDEIKALFTQVLLAPISTSNLFKLYTETGGWAAALLLFFNAMNGKAVHDSNQRIFKFNKSEKFIFSYLEEIIFESQPDQIQWFMMVSALLDRMEVGFCNKLLKIKNARKILQGLCDKHLLTFACDEDQECYQYHHLLKEFLCRRLINQCGEDTFFTCHCEIAALMEEEKNLYGALKHFMLGRNYEAVSRMLSGLVLLDINYIPLFFIKKLLDFLPEEFFQKNARLIYFKARLAEIKGDMFIAQDHLKRALGYFQDRQDVSGIAICIKDLGFHYYLFGDIDKAIEQMEAIKESSNKDPFFPAEVMGYLIFFSSVAGDFKKAERYYHEALKSHDLACGLDQNFVHHWLLFCYAFKFHAAGDFIKADALNTKVLDFFSHSEVSLFLPIVHFQTALTLYYSGQWSKAHACAQKGLEITIQLEFYSHQYPWLLFIRALSQFKLQNTASVLKDVDEALEIFCLTNNAWGQACLYEFKAMHLRLEGNLVEALTAVQTGFKLVENYNLKGVKAALALELATIFLASDHPRKALKTLERYFDLIDLSCFHLFQYYLLAARIESKLSRPDRALEQIKNALALAHINQFDAWFDLRSTCLTALLAQCYRNNVFSQYIETLFETADRKVHNILGQLAKEKNYKIRQASESLLGALPHKVPASLKIFCLGDFKLFIQDRAVYKKQWRSNKAALLFKYLVLKRDNGLIAKEKLLELLWPEEDAKKTTPRLHVALNFLRKLLEPDLKRGMASAYIIRQKDKYRLEIGPEGWIDITAFKIAVKTAKKTQLADETDSLADYLKAESLYGGQLFKEDPYQQSFTGEREQLQSDYLDVLTRIISLYQGMGRLSSAIKFAEKYLLNDPYYEPVYAELMRFYAKTSNQALMVRTFERCKINIETDLGLTLSPDTLALYQTLLRH